MVGTRMRERVTNPDAIPLLIFPEGTCVNNEYCVLFKRGARQGVHRVCPIKYNKIFVDAFWNSKHISFTPPPGASPGD
jgi:glycerol-3-phosphate O-acyltransferase 3/4